MVETDINQLRQEYTAPSRRQAARAARMSKSQYSSGMTRTMGKLRCVFAVILFLLGAFAFMLGDSETYRTPINQLAPASQRGLSMGICVVACCLLAPSYKRHKFIVGMAIIAMLAMGWHMPTLWHFREPSTADKDLPTEAETADAQQTAANGEDVPEKGRSLTESDLQVFRDVVANAPKLTHYAIYLNTQDLRARDIVREALTRILQAGNTRSYTRAKGVLFVVSNVQGKRVNISPVASRLGKITYSNVSAGIYEVQYDAAKACMHSMFPPEVLGSPTHPSFVSGNVSELYSLDPMRVRAAAQRLKEANVRVLRTDIRDSLLNVLKDSWKTEPDTYAALVDALVVYAPSGDKEKLKAARDYFQYCLRAQCPTSALVMQMLIRESPNEMVQPVVEMWKNNPLAWGGMLNELGSKAESAVLQVLDNTQDHQQLNACLKFLEYHGGSRSIPVVRRFLNHPDSLIARSARTTLERLQGERP